MIICIMEILKIREIYKEVVTKDFSPL
jgi:hypothetical protein